MKPIARFLCLLHVFYLFVFLSPFIKAATIPVPSEDCATYTTCGACIEDNNCGFCDTFGNGTCQTGGPNGPATPNSCSTGLWKYSSCAQDDICSVKMNCKNCTTTDGCGWCDTRCVLGDTLGPSNTSDVPCDQWIFSSDSCDNSSCGTFTTCNVCTNQEMCGWCSQPEIPGQPNAPPVCQTGSKSVPANDCPPEYWISSPQTCPMMTDCSAYKNCSSCIGDVSEECGWCKSTLTCIPRSDVSTCTDFQLNNCNEDCTNFRTCSDCVSHSSCGYCSSYTEGFCTYGNETGPQYFEQAEVCEQSWTYGETCPSCLFYDCNSCLNASCNWCYGMYESGKVYGACYSKPDSDHTCVPQCPKTPSITASPSLTVSPTASQSILPTTTSTPTPTPSESLLITNITESATGSLSVTSLSSTPTISQSSSNTTSSPFSRSATPTNTTSQSPTIPTTPSGTGTSTAFSTPTSTPSNSSVMATNSGTTTATSTASTTRSPSRVRPTTTATATATSTGTTSVSGTPSISSTFSETITSTATGTSTVTSVPSNTTTESRSQSRFHASDTPTPTADNSVTSSTSSSLSSSISVSATNTMSASYSSSPSVTLSQIIIETQSLHIPLSFTLSPSKTNTTSVSHSQFYITHSPTLSLSNTATPNTVPNTPDIHWAAIVFISLACIVLVAIILVVAGYIFYGYYWSRRWYFQKLE